jgi:small nuclear ribonucleoprotein (snRNP)-like protein
MATTMNKKGPKQKSLGSLLPYFIGMELTIEQKTGRLYTGTLSAADDAMNLTLDDATLATHSGSRSSSSSGPLITPIFAIVHIRGSTIRYIHFPERVDLAVIIKQGMDRERSVAQKYKRGVRR